jgi:hypothetical protein
MLGDSAAELREGGKSIFNGAIQIDAGRDVGIASTLTLN